MKFVLIFTFLIASITCFGQKPKKVVKENEELGYKETFYVLLDSPDVKHGEYVRKSTSSRESSEKGQYSHGKRTGVWTFTGDAGKVEHQIDFTNQKVISALPNIALERKQIITAEGMVENTSQTLPLYLGGQSRIMSIWVRNLRYPASARRMGVDGTVHVSGTVTKEGKLTDLKVNQGISADCDAEAVRVIQLLTDEWLPAGWGEDPVDSKVLLKVRFKLN
jgi:periplasmic protein TonB